ncbi:choice-of-anchor D domain-containing protein [bacterium]|nr:choice-of-anchor D domain-containing protein [bacterium]
MNATIIPSLLSFTLLTSAQAAEVLYFSMEESTTPLVDAVGGLQANAIDTGHIYQVDGPTGFGKAIGLTENGSWQFSESDSAVMRDLANNFSVAVWVYLDSTLIATKTGPNSALNRVVGDDVGWDADGWAMGVWADGRVRFTKNGIVDIDLGGEGAVPTDEWAHIAATVSSTEGSKLFVNGVPVGSNANTADCNTGVGNNGTLDIWGIGRTYGIGESQWFGGQMDELHVFNHVLTEGEVADLMVVPRDPALVTNLLFTEEGNGSAQTLTLTIDNDGENKDLNLTGVTFAGADAGDFAQGTLPGAISPEAQGDLEITFTPSDGSRLYTTTAIIASNDPEKPSFEVTLEINVVDPIIRVEGDLDFGDVAATPVSRDVTVINDGFARNLEVSAIRFSGPRGSVYTVDPATATVVPGASATLTVTFDPAGEAGTFSATMEIDSNDIGTSTATLPVTATIPLGPASKHLVSHFTFDQSTQVGNDSGSFDLDGTVFGDATFTADSRVGGGALLLDGIDDYLIVNGANEYSTLDDNGVGFTLAAWVCLDENAFGTARIFSTYMEAGFTAEGWGVGFGGVDGSSLLATTYGRIDYLSPDISKPATGEWHHLAYVYRNSPIDEVEYFVDGVSVGNRTTAGATTGMIDSATGFAIGGIAIPGNPQNFFGKIDDLRIYEVELTNDEIVELANTSSGGGRFQIIETSHKGTSFDLTWNSLSGRRYVVERSFDDPISGSTALKTWEELDDDVLASDGATTTYTDLNLPTGVGRVFYRVSEAP